MRRGKGSKKYSGIVRACITVTLCIWIILVATAVFLHYNAIDVSILLMKRKYIKNGAIDLYRYKRTPRLMPLNVQ